MAHPLKFKKVNAKPATPDPDTLYMVKNGAGFDLYVSDSAGTKLYPTNTQDEIEPFLLMGVSNG